MLINKTLLATGNKRFANYIIDTIFYFIIYFFINITSLLSCRWFNLEESFFHFSDIFSFKWFVFWVFFWQLLYFLQEYSTQRTLGKYITGTKVVLATGLKPGAEFILVRTLCRLIPLEALSFGEIEVELGYHDSISKTYVIDVKKFETALLLNNAFDEIGTVEQ